MRRARPLDAETRVADRAQADQGPDSQLLEVAQDPVGAVDVALQQVLQAVEAVQATAPLTDLDQPRPHPLRWRSDRDGSAVAQPWCCHELITWHGPADLGIGGAPAVVPRPEQRGYKRHRENLGATDEHVSGGGATHVPPPGPDTSASPRDLGAPSRALDPPHTLKPTPYPLVTEEHAADPLHGAPRRARHAKQTLSCPWMSSVDILPSPPTMVPHLRGLRRREHHAAL